MGQGGFKKKQGQAGQIERGMPPLEPGQAPEFPGRFLPFCYMQISYA